MTATGRPAEGERALVHTETYVAACRRVATVPLTPERVDELYRAEDGLRLTALDADGAALAAAAAAAQGALDIERDAVGALSAAWQGGTGSAAMDFLNRQCESAAQTVSGLRMAADALRGLRAELAPLVDAKIDAAVSIDDRRSEQRGRWLLDARAVLAGAADDAAIDVVRQQIVPYVIADIAGDWVTAMTSATESVRAAYVGAVRSLTGHAPARFEFPAMPTAGPTAGAPPVRAARSRSAPATPAPAPVPAPAVAAPPAAPAVGALPADLGAMAAPAWPQPLAGTLDGRDLPPLRTKRDAEPADPTPDETKPDETKPEAADRAEVKPATDSATAVPAQPAPLPSETPAAQQVPDPAPAAEAPPPLMAAEVPATADERTPCEIAADELPQVGE